MKSSLHRSSRFIALLAIPLIVGSVGAAWLGRPDVKVSLTGTVERDRQAIQLEKAGQLNPGEILHWTITSQNSGTAPAHHYKTIGEIPAGTAYVPGSARAAGEPTIVYSIDGGQSYDARPLLEQKQPDGSVRRVPAPPTMYTHIRFEWTEPLSEGKQLTAFYKVRVK